MNSLLARNGRLWALALILLASALSQSAFSQDRRASSPGAHEIWVALRADGVTGTGTATDPFDATAPGQLDRLFEKFARDYGNNLTIHFGPGVFLGTHRWAPRNNWKIRGAGRDITILRTRANPGSIETIGFRADPFPDGSGPNGFEMSDLTVDFNTPALRKANRALVYLESASNPQVTYYFLSGIPAEWKPDIEYTRYSMFLSRTDQPVAVRHKDKEFIVAKASQGREPAQNAWWSELWPIAAEKLPGWKSARTYARGGTVAKDGRSYICVAEQTTAEPTRSGPDWRELDPNAPDPMIYTHAAFIVSPLSGGRNRVERVRVINGCGSRFFDQEAFLIGLGGDDCAIEDCQVDLFRGDYSSCLVLFRGQGSVIRGCTVRGNGGSTTMGYGGWQCSDCVFEGNFGFNLAWASNIDSLANRNCVFRNNLFRECYIGGIRISLDGRPCPVSPTQTNLMDGLIIQDNLVELTPASTFGAVQLQADGLSNVRVLNNTFRTSGGHGEGRLAVAVSGKPRNLEIAGNVCDPGMHAKSSVPIRSRDNHDSQGNPIKGLENPAIATPR